MVVIRIDFAKLGKKAKEDRWSSYKIADKAGISAGTVLKILTGRSKNPEAINLKKVCDVIGVPIEDVFIKEVFERVAA